MAMDITKNASDLGGSSPWGGTEGPGMTSSERMKEKANLRFEARKKEPMAQMGQMIVSTILEAHKGYPKEYAEFIGWLSVGAIPNLEDMPAWPGHVEEAEAETKEEAR
jgi:hypothetical protein